MTFDSGSASVDLQHAETEYLRMVRQFVADAQDGQFDAADEVLLARYRVRLAKVTAAAVADLAVLEANHRKQKSRRERMDLFALALDRRRSSEKEVDNASSVDPADPF